MARVTKLPIWKLKNKAEKPILRRSADTVSVELLASDEIQRLIANMIPSMYAAKGIGLAAPQVGVSLRIAVIGREATNGRDDLVIVNPVLSPIGTQTWDMEEGCLSVPKVYGMVPRLRRIKLQALNQNGEPIELIAEDMFARVIQHEVDHLQGRIFIDRTTEFTHGHPPA
jgi:peptide deformylase